MAMKHAKRKPALAASTTAATGGKGPNQRKVNKYVPDSSLGDWAFQKSADWYLDPARKNPEDDPALQPYINALTSSLGQQHAIDMSTLDAQASGAGRMGSSYYNSAIKSADTNYQQNLGNTVAGVYENARQSALANELNVLGLGNERDIASGQIAAQFHAANQQAATARAQLGFERQKWNEQMPLMYMDSLTGLLGNIDNLGGYGLSPGYIPTPAPPGGPNNAGILAGALASGYGAYAGYNKNAG